MLNEGKLCMTLKHQGRWIQLEDCKTQKYIIS